MTAPYRWRGVTFNAPSLEDETVLSFVDYDKERAVASMTVTEDQHAGALQEFVDATNVDVNQTFPGWREAIVSSSDALIVTTHGGESSSGAQVLARGFRQIGTAVFSFTAMGPQTREADLVAWVKDAATSVAST